MQLKEFSFKGVDCKYFQNLEVLNLKHKIQFKASLNKIEGKI